MLNAAGGGDASDGARLTRSDEQQTAAASFTFLLERREWRSGAVCRGRAHRLAAVSSSLQVVHTFTFIFQDI